MNKNAALCSNALSVQKTNGFRKLVCKFIGAFVADSKAQLVTWRDGAETCSCDYKAAAKSIAQKIDADFTVMLMKKKRKTLVRMSIQIILI